MSGALREVLAKFGFELDDSKLKTAIAETDAFSSKLAGLGKLLAGGLLVAKGKEWLEQIADQSGELDDNAVRLGINTHALQQWQTAAKMAGVASGGIETAMLVLQKNAAGATSDITAMTDAATDIDGIPGGNKAAAEAFKSLGIEVKDAAGKIKPVDQLMQETGLAIASIQDPAKRTQAALKVFGKQGVQLATLFAGGGDGLKEALATLDEFGGGIADDVIPMGAAYGDMMDQMGVATLSLKAAVAREILPTINAFILALAKGVGWLSKTAKHSEILKAGVLVVGAAMAWQGRQAALAGLKTALAYAPLILAFAAIILIVDDLITMFEGGDSAIKDFIESVFGVGSAKEVIDSLKSAWGTLSGVIDEIPAKGKLAAAGLLFAGIAAGTAAAPFVALAAAILAVTNAYLEAKKLAAEWDENSGTQIVNKLKHDLGITSDAEFQAATDKRQGLVSGDAFDKKKNNDAFDAHLTASENRQAAEKGQNIPASLKYLASIPDPMVSSSGYAPSVKGGKGGPAVQHNNASITNKVDITIKGGDAPAVADALKGTLPGTLDESRKAALAALETLGG